MPFRLPLCRVSESGHIGHEGHEGHNATRGAPCFGLYFKQLNGELT